MEKVETPAGAEPMTTARSSESWVLYEILKAWGSHPRLRLWRNNTGVAKLGDRTVKFGIVGQADISGLIAPSGRRLEIECKTPTGRQSEAQRVFQHMVETMGGVYCLARSVEDVDQFMAVLGITR